MAYDYANHKFNDSDLLTKLKNEKKAANELQQRRHTNWTDNYDLYRGKVKTNRLTQRQEINIPLMKETIETKFSRIDDMPIVDWVELAGDEEKEIIYQEVWNEVAKTKKYELVDALDKKNVLLYGTGTKTLNIEKDGISIDAEDPYDVVYDPLMKVGEVETARFIVRQNIFRTVREILADPKYTKQGKHELKIWADAPAGLTQTQYNKEQWKAKMQRLEDMGVNSDKFPLFAAGDRLINLTEHFTNIWDSKKNKWERRVIIYAEDCIELMNESLYDVLGVDFWPFTVWNSDPDSQDIYPDATADIVRPGNKVLNVWFSQMIENRTLKNFQMHWYMPGENYKPQTYVPGPGVMLPAPKGDDINKVIKPVEVSGLDDTLNSISAVTQIIERATGATAIEKGEPEKGSQTLGEVQILVGKAMERNIGMAKFYKMAWYETAWKWDKLMHANAPKFLKLYKQSRSGKVYPKRVYAGDWKSEAGYEPLIRSSSEQEQEAVKGLQKFQAVMQMFPNNPALRKISQKRSLEMLDLTPEELKQVEEAEEQQIQAGAATPGVPDPNAQQESGQIESLVGQLTT